jgi:hypothetical protein
MEAGAHGKFFYPDAATTPTHTRRMKPKPSLLASRIRRVMLADDEVGKIAQPVPGLIGERERKTRPGDLCARSVPRSLAWNGRHHARTPHALFLSPFLQNTPWNSSWPAFWARRPPSPAPEARRR